MKNEIQLFSFESQQVRTVIVNSEPYFVGKDVAEILEYSDTNQAIRKHVDDEDKLTRQFNGSGQNRSMTIINESGLYSLILSSKMPNAKKFKRWVTSEVLPTIRKNGIYMTNAKAQELVTNPTSLADLLQQAADQLKMEQQARLEAEQRLEDAQPAVEFYEDFADLEGAISIKQFAGVLISKDLWMGNPWDLYKDFRNRGFTLSAPGQKNNPSTQSIRDGYLIAKHGRNPYTGEVYIQSMITPLGIEYYTDFYRRLASTDKV